MITLRWKNAKTYPDAPHEYILREWDPAVFDFFQEKIRTDAKPEEFTLRGRTALYHYYSPGDGYKYWIIQNVLNRAKVASEPHESVAASFDAHTPK